MFGIYIKKMIKKVLQFHFQITFTKQCFYKKNPNFGFQTDRYLWIKKSIF